MRKIQWAIVSFVLILLLSPIIWLCCSTFARQRAAIANPCVLDYPRQAVSGYIHHSSGIFSDGSESHYLNYRGKRKLTGDACEERYRVTEREYERRMYIQEPQR